jgi:hypothetical protein
VRQFGFWRTPGATQAGQAGQGPPPLVRQFAFWLL